MYAAQPPPNQGFYYQQGQPLAPEQPQTTMEMLHACACGSTPGNCGVSRSRNMPYLADYQEPTYHYVGPTPDTAPPPSEGCLSKKVIGVIVGAIVLVALLVLLVVFVVVPTIKAHQEVSESRVDTYDCDKDYDNWRSVWPAKQKAWCCSNALKGCEDGHDGTTVQVDPNQRADPNIRKTCSIYGAGPHISTFDNTFIDFNSEGEVWLLKSKEVHIQAKFLKVANLHGLAAVHALAVGGPALDGHILKVGPLEGGSIMWNDESVLTSFGSMDLDGYGKAQYDDMGGQQSSYSQLQKHVVHVQLAQGVHLEVMRWQDHLTLRIEMFPMPPQDGYCGNFNGAGQDDTRFQVEQRMGEKVAKEDMLFEFIAWTTRDNRIPWIDDCHPVARDKARDSCLQKRADLSGKALDACVYDTCFAGENYANEDVLY